MKLYNTLGRQLQEFRPLKAGQVSVYTCGPTVYDYQHIGNYSGYIYWDILVRLLRSQGYQVKRVMNITDVGHLVSDADEGEDKLEKAAKHEKKSAKQVADFYSADFLKSMDILGLIKPDQYARATDFIPQQIEIIQRLIDKNIAYQAEQAIYFDVTKLDNYGKLTGQNLADKEVGARSEVVTDSAKHHPQDFAVWFFAVGRFADHEMRWDSPWGSGFPGWHLECSAIVHATLGEPIDIHAGGVDHIGTHHTNEIAQSEAAFNKTLANFWVHNNHMMVDGRKISKSLGNGFTLKDLEEKGFSAMDFKLFVLQSHYRSQANFTWEALEAAKNRLGKWKAAVDLLWQEDKAVDSGLRCDEYEDGMLKILQDDLDTPRTVAFASEAFDKIENLHLCKLCIENIALTIHQLLGIDLLAGKSDISTDQKQTISNRDEARKKEDWTKSDELRVKLEEQGIGLRDTERGSIWYRI